MLLSTERSSSLGVAQGVSDEMDNYRQRYNYSVETIDFQQEGGLRSSIKGLKLKKNFTP